MLGWGLLCPFAMDLLWHGAIPLHIPEYPTAEEYKDLHERLKKIVDASLGNIGIISRQVEHELIICFFRGDEELCSNSKADLVYTVASKNTLMTLYIEVAGSRINVVKPWQALLRGISLYYERRLPVGVVIVSLEKIMYKIVSEIDQVKVLSRLRAGREGFNPQPSLCSLCELHQFCSQRAF